MQMPTPDAAVIARKAQLVDRLRGVLPADAVIDDVAETRAYECDGLSAYRCPPLAAIANAVSAAAGVRLRELPMSPPRILEALEQQGGG